MGKTNDRFLISTNGIVLSEGRIAWRFKDISRIMDAVRDNKWVVLGGDVVTEAGQHTYDSWYYEPNVNLPLEDNIDNSINACVSFVSNYVSSFGDCYLFILVISDAYINSYR